MLYTIHTLPRQARTLPGYTIGAFLEHANMALRADLPERDAIAVGLSAARVEQEGHEQTQERADRGSAGRVARVDRVALRIDASTVVRHENGWVDVWGVATRVGVFEYEDPGSPGGIFREYRPRDEVMDPASLGTLDGVPFTIEHPDDGVDSANARNLTHGWVLAVKTDGDLVLTRIRVATDDALEAIQAGKLELSCGYTTKLEALSGVSDGGEPFDAVQRDIRYNHLALVDSARAGHVARLRFDSLRVQRQDSGKAPQTMKRFKLTHDGKTIECPGALLTGLRSAHIDTAREKRNRADMKTAAVRIEMEGDEPTDLVLPLPMVEEMMSMLGGMTGGGEAVETEVEEPGGDAVGEPAPEPEAVEGGESPEGAPAAMEEPEDGGMIKRGDAVTRADLDAALEAERKRADARARHRASVERRAAMVLDAGFGYESATTEEIQAAVIGRVFEGRADEAKTLAAAAARGDSRSAGALDGIFGVAVTSHADARQREVEAAAGEHSAQLIKDGKGQPANGNRVDAARQRMLDRIQGRETA